MIDSRSGLREELIFIANSCPDCFKETHSMDVNVSHALWCDQCLDWIYCSISCYNVHALNQAACSLAQCFLGNVQTQFPSNYITTARKQF